MINETMQKMLNDYSVKSASTIKIQVDLNPSQLAVKLANEITRDIARICNFVGFHDVDVEESDILKYLKTLAFLRVSTANGDLFVTQALKPYRKLTQFVFVPVMFYQCLISIGIATDRDYGLRFEPTYSIDGTDLLSPEELIEISEMMDRLEPHGLKVVKGIPKDSEGDLDFMALCHVESQVLGYRRSHPVYGFLASFFEQKKLCEVTGAMCRVIYGYDSDYELYVSQLYQKMTT